MAAIVRGGELLTAGARPLPRTDPEALAIDPGGILAFVEAVEQQLGGLHSFMLLRRGQVAAEGWWSPYAAEHPHMLFSLSKSFASTAVGLAVAEGRLTVDDPVLSFFPSDAPEKVDENLAAMRVRHLLTMSTGHDKDALDPTTSAPDGNWAKAFLALPVEHEPGTHFVYNSTATYMLSAIVQQLTGVTLLEYLRPRLFEPLGIEGATWESCPRGINVGGWGLSVRTEEIARFGQLYLQNGEWEGRQLLPAAWVAEASRKQVSNAPSQNPDWEQGYGYQFWRCRHDAYRGDGAFGQFCAVMPGQETVLAITSGVPDMQAVLNAVWEHLLPALGGRESSPIRSTKEDLAQRLAGLAIRLPEGQPASPTARRVSGRSFRFEANEEKIQSVTFTFEANGSRLTLRDEQGEHSLECCSGAWVKGSAELPDRGVRRVAASGAWSDPDTYTMQLCFYETPFIESVTCRFAGDEVAVSRRANVGFGPTERPTLVGRLV
jgi:CubicO group peptidase (beta-lactamase class C family)